MQENWIPPEELERGSVSFALRRKSSREKRKRDPFTSCSLCQTLHSYPRVSLSLLLFLQNIIASLPVVDVESCLLPLRVMWTIFHAEKQPYWCIPSHTGEFVVLWRKEMSRILYAGTLQVWKDTRIRLSNNNANGNFNLHLNGVKEDDAGEYVCMISYPGATPVLVTHHLRVLGKYYHFHVTKWHDSYVCKRAAETPSQLITTDEWRVMSEWEACESHIVSDRLTEETLLTKNNSLPLITSSRSLLSPSSPEIFFSFSHSLFSPSHPILHPLPLSWTLSLSFPPKEAAREDNNESRWAV